MTSDEERQWATVIAAANQQFELWAKEKLSTDLMTIPERSRRRLRNRIQVAYICGFTAGWELRGKQQYQ